MSRRSHKHKKYSAELKLKAVQDYLNATSSANDRTDFSSAVYPFVRFPNTARSPHMAAVTAVRTASSDLLQASAERLRELVIDVRYE